MTSFRPVNSLSALAMLLILLQLTACAAPGYYVQAVAGHLKLMREGKDIAEVLAAADTDPQLRRKLELAGELREFATQQLGLPDNGSYTRLVRTGRDAVTWNVVATPELSLEARRWCFPVAGCVPYRGYFEREAATRFAEQLRGEGFDVDISPAVAYSTLGWFKDPLLDTMLRSREEQLAAIIFHELAHQKLYLRGDTAFNESYASFIEETGVALWLQSSGRADRLPEWRRQQKAAEQFDDLLLQARRSLSEIYAGPAAEADKRYSKAKIFNQLKTDYRELVDGPWQGRDIFAGWFSKGLNNARLALFASYRGGLCAFTALYHAGGNDIGKFHAQAARLASLEPAARRAWLDQPCPAVASQGDL